MSNLEPMPEIDPLTEFGVVEPDFSWDIAPLLTISDNVWKARDDLLRRTVKATGPHQINCFDHTAKQICQRLMASGFFRSSTGKWLRNHGRVRCVEFFVLPDEFNQQDKRRFRVLATLL